MQEQNTLSFKLNPIFNWFNIQKSNIHGMGLFSQRDILPGESLGIAMVKKSISNSFQEHLIEGYGNSSDDDWLRVIGARFINHTAAPNIKLTYSGSQVLAFALKKINIGDEITANYIDIYQQINLPIPEFCKAIA